MRRLRMTGQHAPIVRAALSAAAIANLLIKNLKRKGLAENPKLVRRIFLFETQDGVDYGFTREEFGAIEPFMSVPVGSPTSEPGTHDDGTEHP